MLLLGRPESQSVGLWVRGDRVESFVGIKYVREYLIMLQGASFFNYNHFHKERRLGRGRYSEVKCGRKMIFLGQMASSLQCVIQGLD